MTDSETSLDVGKMVQESLAANANSLSCKEPSRLLGPNGSSDPGTNTMSFRDLLKTTVMRENPNHNSITLTITTDSSGDNDKTLGDIVIDSPVIEVAMEHQRVKDDEQRNVDSGSQTVVHGFGSGTNSYYERVVSTPSPQPRHASASTKDMEQESDVAESEPPELHLVEGENSDGNDETALWNQNNCIVCNADFENNLQASQIVSEGNVKLTKFFLEYLGVNETTDFAGDSFFPFCSTCTDDLGKLMTLASKIEFMDLQFEKLRDNLARKTVKTYLCRNRPEVLEDNTEHINDNSEETLSANIIKPLIHPADILFSQWKRQYDMIIPGRYKKFPTLMKSVDPKQRVSYYRIDSAGKHHFISTINPEAPVEAQLMKTSPRGVKRKGDSFLSKVTGDSTTDTKRVKPILRDENRTDDSEFEDVDHALVDSAEDERQYKCTICPKSFNSRSILNYHSRIHSGERPFKCNVCDKTFAQRGGLATHALVHSGEKPYHCDDCGKSFRQKYHLTQHQLIHSGLKPFSCEICHKSFNVKMNLREHMRRHTGERPYRCPFCTNSGFFRKKMLRDHIVKTHPERPLPGELQTLGPTPKFQKSRPGKLTPENFHRVFDSKGKIVRKASENRLLIKAEQVDESVEEILSIPTSATLISIDIHNEHQIPQLNIMEDVSGCVGDTSSVSTLPCVPMKLERKLSQNLGTPEPILENHQRKDLSSVLQENVAGSVCNDESLNTLGSN